MQKGKKISFSSYMKSISPKRRQETSESKGKGNILRKKQLNRNQNQLMNAIIDTAQTQSDKHDIK